MRVVLIPADQTGCGFHRMLEPARVVSEAHGDDVEVLVADRMTVLEWAGQYIGADTGNADVVVVQRPDTDKHLAFLRLAQAQGAAVVVEIDDLVAAVPPEHFGYRKLVEERSEEYLATCCREADWVTVSTPALLAHYVPHGRGSVVPNAIPRWIAELPPAYETRSESVTIGWSGAVSTHPLDLRVVGAGLENAFEGTTARFAVWAPQGVAELLGVEPVHLPWRSDVEDFLMSLARLDVGLAPLADNAFNRAKSWLKPLEYAARGVLPLHSGIGEYARSGVGLSARLPREWTKLTKRAIADQDWRREYAADAHAKVFTRHLTEHTADRWLDAWRAAADVRVRR